MLEMFSVASCPPCAELQNFLTEEGIEFRIVDVSDNPQLAMKIGSFPTLKDGDKILEGLPYTDSLEIDKEKVRKWIKDAKSE